MHVWKQSFTRLVTICIFASLQRILWLAKVLKEVTWTILDIKS